MFIFLFEIRRAVSTLFSRNGQGENDVVKASVGSSSGADCRTGVRESERTATGRTINYDVNSDMFWTDSRVVLGHTANEARRLHVFVAYIIQHITTHHNRASHANQLAA